MSAPHPHPKAKTPWKVLGKQPRGPQLPSTAPPPAEVREQRKDRFQNAGGHLGPQPSPGPFRPQVLHPWKDITVSTIPGLRPRYSGSRKTPGSGGPEPPCTTGRSATLLERRQFPTFLPVSEASASVYVPFSACPGHPSLAFLPASLSSGRICCAFLA